MTEAITPGSAELLAKAAQDFIDKVDRGEAKSIKSYAAFKAALATKPDEEGWRESAAKWLEREADQRTDSLHCGDNSITIQRTYNTARAFKLAAKIIRALSTTGEPKPCQ